MYLYQMTSLVTVVGEKNRTNDFGESVGSTAGKRTNLEQGKVCIPHVTDHLHGPCSEGNRAHTRELQGSAQCQRTRESPSEVRSFLGLANYNAWFIPNFATVAEPLRQLMKKGVPFKFSRTQREAFPELKRRLTHAETVGYFNKDVSMYTFYGFEFEMYTYHKPLETIYSTRSKPCARIE